ncbi:nuclear transport factor 2 family protein [Ancylobacter pratisalsi]|uniref:Nuclear transport factor 2 family protein n=1 Tax=Ancylobacter pratisalsi TaxID=1745854 RepID=A0A6P1YIM7_9HYPH|nr:nuclear transport factor 2 family protein [Ancylobacter pratisalsi]QIB33169.1 nuclear transport factor 2 family protein [Ancylobacter pratisalsi]
MRLSTLAAILISAAASGSAALAGTAEDLARSRIAAIASGDMAVVSAAYGPAAALHWVGGPLDGTYSEQAKIKEVWSKFFAAQGAQKATIAAAVEAANPKGGTVTADITFAGKNTVKVRYVLLYRDDKLVDEIWQVNPAATY